MQITEEIEIVNDAIAGYTLRRSLSSPRLLDVVAINAKGEMLTVVESDVDFDKAMQLVEALNAPKEEL